MAEQFKALATKLEAQSLTIAVKAGTSGKIFGSVTSVQIVNAIKEVHGVDIERKKVVLTEEVKELGSYVADINLSKQVLAKVPFEVIVAE
jgi:large subunit ribosomal protein L9